MKFFRTDPAAEILGLKGRTLEKWRVAGRGPKFRKFGGIVMYEAGDLFDFAEAATRTSTSDPGPARRSTRSAR